MTILTADIRLDQDVAIFLFGELLPQIEGGE